MRQQGVQNLSLCISASLSSGVHNEPNGYC
jgi:hypothetical protein